MDYLTGALTALGVGAFGTLTGLDRERGFYATILVVVGSYYVLFAVLGGAPSAVAPETGIFAVYAAVAAWGFRRDLRIVMAGLVAHGVMDFVMGGVSTNAGIPAFWPAFCGTFDIVAPAYLAVLVWRGRVQLRSAPG